MVTRSPFVEQHDDFVVVQRPYKYGYLTEYPAWFINRHRFITFIETRGLVREREFTWANARLSRMRRSIACIAGSFSKALVRDGRFDKSKFVSETRNEISEPW